MRLFGIALLVLLYVSLPAGGQNVKLQAEMKGSTILASVSFRWEREEELLSSLRDGLESRISFTVRLYEKRPLLLPFLGDALAAEKSVSRNAFFDFLEGEFVVETENGLRTMFENPRDLLVGFFNISVPIDARGLLQKPYVSVRVRFDPVRLMPPLTIVSLIGATGAYTSPWIQQEVSGPVGRIGE